MIYFYYICKLSCLSWNVQVGKNAPYELQANVNDCCLEECRRLLSATKSERRCEVALTTQWHTSCDIKQKFNTLGIVMIRFLVASYTTRRTPLPCPNAKYKIVPFA